MAGNCAFNVALPALFIPASFATVDLSPEVAERLRASWGAWWEPFREELRRAPPVEASPEERSALARFAVHGFSMMSAFPGDQAKALQQAVQSSVEQLLLQAAQDVETERRLGFHWLQQAMETLGRIVDRFVYAMPKGGMEQAVGLLPKTTSEIERHLDAPSVSLLRLELNVQPNDVDLRAETILDSRGVATVLQLLRRTGTERGHA